MKKLIYEVYNDERRVETETYEGEPYIFYRENSCGIYLEAALRDEEIEEILKNIESLHLPDDILLALGINVGEEEGLEELCERVKKEGIECEFKAFDDERCGYTEVIKIKLKARRKVKLVVIEEGERKKVKTEKARGPLLQYVYSPPKRILEVNLEEEVVSQLKDIDIKSLIQKVLGEEVDPDDVVEVLDVIDSNFDEYVFSVERDGERIRWKFSLK